MERRITLVPCFPLPLPVFRNLNYYLLLSPLCLVTCGIKQDSLATPPAIFNTISQRQNFGPLPSLPWPLGHVCLISFLGLVCAALLFFSTCWSSNSGPSGPVSKPLGGKRAASGRKQWHLSFFLYLRPLLGLTKIRQIFDPNTSINTSVP